MDELVIKINREVLSIDKQVFIDLLDVSPLQEYKKYSEAITNNKISFHDLKDLAIRGGIPYALFFAPREIVKKHIEEKNRNLIQKIPTKDELKIGTRGFVELKDIELVVKDIGRKQEFLKSRILTSASQNTYIGSIVKKVKLGFSIEEIAEGIRNEFDIDLSVLRTLSKEKVLDYLRSCIEKKGILVSFSSHNYMPQNLDRELTISGICIKDKKFPFIFVNTRDGDEKPRIIESSGRQIFTLLTMVVCIGLNQFVLSSKKGKGKNDVSKLAYKVASEILIPKNHLTNITPLHLETLKEKAHFFKVTPSMLLYQLKENKKIDAASAETLWAQLKVEAQKKESKVKHQPLPVTGYSKYNGDRFSREVVKAYTEGAITHLEVKNILFRKGKKMDATLWNKYLDKYRTHQ